VPADRADALEDGRGVGLFRDGALDAAQMMAGSGAGPDPHQAGWPHS